MKNLKIKLEELLGRKCTDSEIINAENDALLLCRILIEKVEELEKRILKLENK